MNVDRVTKRLFMAFALSATLLLSGGFANLSVIGLNGGRMPVEHYTLCGEDYPEFQIIDKRHQCANPQTRLRLLDDRFIYGGMIYSVGDAALVTGQTSSILAASFAVPILIITRKKKK